MSTPSTSNKYSQSFPPFLNIYNYNPYTNNKPTDGDWVYYVYTNNNNVPNTFNHILTDVFGDKVWVLSGGPGGYGGGEKNAGCGGGGGPGELVLSVLENSVNTPIFINSNGNKLDNAITCYIGSLNPNTENGSGAERTTSSSCFIYNSILSIGNTVTTTVTEKNLVYPNQKTELTRTRLGWKNWSSAQKSIYETPSNSLIHYEIKTETYTYKGSYTGYNKDDTYSTKYRYEMTTVTTTTPYTIKQTLVKAKGGFCGNSTENDTGANGGTGGGMDYNASTTQDTSSATTFRFGSGYGGAGGGVNNRGNGEKGNQTICSLNSGTTYNYNYQVNNGRYRSGGGCTVDFGKTLNGNQCDNTGSATLLVGGDGGERTNNKSTNGNNASPGFIMIFHKTTNPLTQNISPPSNFWFGYNPFTNNPIYENVIHQNVFYYTNSTSPQSIPMNDFNNIFSNAVPVQALLVGGGGGGGNTWFDGCKSFGGGGGGSGGITIRNIPTNITSDIVITVGRTGRTYDTPDVKRNGSNGEDGGNTTIQYNGLTISATGGGGGERATFDNGPAVLGGVNNGGNGRGRGSDRFPYSEPGAHYISISGRGRYAVSNGIISNEYFVSSDNIQNDTLITYSGDGGDKHANSTDGFSLYWSNDDGLLRDYNVTMPRHNGLRGGPGYVLLIGQIRNFKF